MPNIVVGEAQAWLEETKLTLGTLEGELESQVSAQVLSSLADIYDVSLWTSPETTPKLVRSIIAMTYAARLYNRQYSEDVEVQSYGDRLLLMAAAALQSIADGSVTLLDAVVSTEAAAASSISFYPNDAAGALDSDEDVKFTMGRIW